MKRVVGLVVMMAWLVPVWLYGQGYLSFRYEREQIIRSAKFKIGPFRFYPTIRLRDIGYDSNVYYQNKAEGPTSDFTGTISPQVKVYFLFHNYLILSLSENPEYVYYFKQKKERGWNNTLSPEIKLLLLNRFVLSGSYSTRNRRYRATPEFNVRVSEHRQGYKGSLFYESARSTSFGISVSSEEILYEDIRMGAEELYLSRWLNRKEQEASLEFYYRIFSESFFFLRGGYKEYNFKHPLYHWRDAYSYQAYAGIRFPFLGRIRGALSLGYKQFVPREKDKKGFSGLVGNTGIDFRVSRFFLRLRYNRDCYFSYWSDNIIFIENRWGTGISFYLTKFLRLDYDFSYGEANYPEVMFLWLPDGSYEEILRKDIYHIHTAGFVIRIIRNTGIGLMVNYWKRDSNYYWETRDRMFVGGFVTYEF